MGNVRDRAVQLHVHMIEETSHSSYMTVKEVEVMAQLQSGWLPQQMHSISQGFMGTPNSLHLI